MTATLAVFVVCALCFAAGATVTNPAGWAWLLAILAGASAGWLASRVRR